MNYGKANLQKCTIFMCYSNKLSSNCLNWVKGCYQLPTGFCQNTACADKVFIDEQDYHSSLLHNTLRRPTIKIMQTLSLQIYSQKIVSL